MMGHLKSVMDQFPYFRRYFVQSFELSQLCARENVKFQFWKLKLVPDWKSDRRFQIRNSKNVYSDMLFGCINQVNSFSSKGEIWNSGPNWDRCWQSDYMSEISDSTNPYFDSFRKKREHFPLKTLVCPTKWSTFIFRTVVSVSWKFFKCFF